MEPVPDDAGLTFTCYETTGWSLRSRIKFAISFLLTPLTVILIGRSIRVTAHPAKPLQRLEYKEEDN